MYGSSISFVFQHSEMCGSENFWESMDGFGMKEFGVSGDKPLWLGLEALCFLVVYAAM